MPIYNYDTICFLNQWRRKLQLTQTGVDASVYIVIKMHCYPKLYNINYVIAFISAYTRHTENKMNASLVGNNKG